MPSVVGESICLSTAAFHMKLMEDAVRDRRKNDACHENNNQAAVKRIQARKELATKTDRRIQWPHAP